MINEKIKKNDKAKHYGLTKDEWEKLITIAWRLEENPLPSLDANLYLSKFEKCNSHKGIVGGTIHDFIKESEIVHNDELQRYEIWHHHPVSGLKCFIGGNYEQNGQPKMYPEETLDF